MYENLNELKNVCASCEKCALGGTRTNLVFGVGNPQAEILFVGEGPGENEDLQGEPFVGKAGQLLDKYLNVIGLDRSKNVYIANIVKCRPPNNRTPLKEESIACLDYLRNQVMIIKPKIIVLLGNTALKNILGEEYGITATRGKWIDKKGIKYMPTYHPAALLRDESKKIDFWNDLELVKRESDENNYII